MPLGRYFRGLTSFDLLGSLIPGLLTLVAVLFFLPGSRIPSTVFGYGILVTVAFIIGFIIQAHASKAGGERTSFDKTMTAAESLPGLAKVQSDSDDTTPSNESQTDESHTDESNRSELVTNALLSFLHAILGPLLWPVFPERGERLDDAILINRIWNHLSETHSIPDNTESLNVLYHLMSSRVDNIQSPSRAVRMQAIRNFQRGLWISAWYSTTLVIIAIIADSCFEPGQTIYPGVIYARPAYFSYWTPLWHLALVGAVGVVLFWSLFESFEEDYVEYLFIDYAIGIETPSQEIHFSDDEMFKFTGSISNEITADPNLVDNVISTSDGDSPTTEEETSREEEEDP